MIATDKSIIITLAVPVFLIFHAMANALFLTMVMILKRFGIGEVFDKALKHD